MVISKQISKPIHPTNCRNKKNNDQLEPVAKRAARNKCTILPTKHFQYVPTAIRVHSSKHINNSSLCHFHEQQNSTATFSNIRFSLPTIFHKFQWNFLHSNHNISQIPIKIQLTHKCMKKNIVFFCQIVNYAICDIKKKATITCH